MKSTLRMLVVAACLLAVALVGLLGLGGQFESALAWGKGMKDVQDSTRCDAQAVGSGARGEALKAVKSTCMNRLAGKRGSQ